MEEYFLVGVIISLFCSFSNSWSGQQDGRSRQRLFWKMPAERERRVPPISQGLCSGTGEAVSGDQQVNRRAEGL